MTTIDADIYTGILSLFSVLAILFNAGTLISIIACRSLRKTQNIFTFNIALGDFVSSAVVVIQRWLADWAGIYHSVFTSVLGAGMMIGICSTLAVAIHRFIIIRLDPFQNRRFVTATRCVITCVIMWAVVFAVFIGTYLINDSLFLFFIFPIIILCAIGITAICYTVVYITISKPPGDIGLSSDAYLLRVKRNKKVLCPFVLVVCSNIVCWVFMCFSMICLKTKPSFIRTYYPEYDRYLTANWFFNLYNIAWWMVSINAVINPIIYWTRLSDFRKLICSCCGRRDVKDQSSTTMTKDSKIESESDHRKNEMNMEDIKGINHGFIHDKEEHRCV